MSKLIFCILSVTLCFQYIFAGKTVYLIHDPIPQESKSAKDVANLFTLRLEETADFAQLSEELYVSDFIERYINHQKNLMKMHGASGSIFFAPGLEYAPQLLEEASTDEWKRFYVATSNLLYFGIVTVMNRSAKDLLRGKTPDDKMLKDIYPPKVTTLFAQHPLLSNLIERKETPKPIRTREEMHSIIATLEQAITLLRSEKAKKPYQLTDDARKLIEMLTQKGMPETAIETESGEFFGYLQGTTIWSIPTPLMFQLIIVNAGGKYKIVWTEPGLD
jgi:hypothetical protein